MSDLGSYVSERFYCEECRAGVLAALKRCVANEGGPSKFLTVDEIPAGTEHAPILAGKIGGQWGGAESHAFEYEFIPIIRAGICPGHDVRFAVLREAGQSLFRVSRVDYERLDVKWADKNFRVDGPAVTTGCQ